jgi:hypothetical protein
MGQACCLPKSKLAGRARQGWAGRGRGRASPRQPASQPSAAARTCSSGAWQRISMSRSFSK